jgi:hypothetical protein
MTWPTIPAALVLPPRRTAPVTTAPPGRVVALLECDDESAYAVAADGPAVRRLDAGDPHYVDMDVQLSPDGTRVAVAGDRELIVQDLTTGAVSALGVDSLIGVEAWSPDGTRVVVDLDEVLAVVDLSTGSHHVIDGTVGTDFYSAAFVPGGGLVIGFDDRVALAFPGGRLVTLSDEYELSGQGSVSPGGDLLALVRPPDYPHGGEPAEFDIALVTTDGEPVGTAKPIEVTGHDIDVLGWRSAGELLISDTGPDGITVFWIGLDGTRSDPLTTGTADVTGIAVATGLIGELRQRPTGEPDYGTARSSRGWFGRG